MGKEKYTPNRVTMTLVEQQGVAKATKNMADRVFKRFEGDVQEVIEGGRYNEDDYKTGKDLKRENIVRYEDILTHLDGVYAAKPTKFAIKIDELAKNFEVIAQRRGILRGKVKEANAPKEEERNTWEVEKGEEDREGSSGSGKRGGSASNSEKQLKQPQGSHPEKISSE